MFAQKEFSFNAVTSWIFSINEKEFNLLSHFEFRCIFRQIFFVFIENQYSSFENFLRLLVLICLCLLSIIIDFRVNCFFKRRFRIVIYTNLNNCIWIINHLKQISNNRRLLQLFVLCHLLDHVEFVISSNFKMWDKRIDVAKRIVNTFIVRICNFNFVGIMEK